MRRYRFFLIGAGILALSVILVEGVPGQQKGGGGGGFGGGGLQNPVTLINNKDVKKELDLTDEQSKQITPEVMAALAKVLNEKQFKRFKQIHLQQQGNNAFKDTGVQKALNLSGEQTTSINTVLEESNKELAGLGGFGGGKGGGKGGGNAEKADKIRKEAAEKINTVLNEKQRATWREMLGEELKITTGFGGGAFKKKDPNKDK
jgi:hypothetical protein